METHIEIKKSSKTEDNDKLLMTEYQVKSSIKKKLLYVLLPIFILVSLIILLIKL